MIIKVENKEYNCPSDWGDVTMGELIGAQELIKAMPEKLKELTFSDKEMDIDVDEEIDIWDFYRKWVVYWTDIPDDISKKIEINGLKLAYEVLQMFMFMPSEPEILKEITFKGVRYGLPKTERLLNGMTKHMANSTYEEFVEGCQLTKRLNKLQDGDLTVLPVLTATFYRPIIIKGRWWWKKEVIEDYDEDKTRERAILFQDLPMDKVWSAYFFLINRLTKYVNGLPISLVEEVKAAQN